MPSRFVRDWVQANYLERLRALWVMHEPEIETVEIIVRPATQPGAPIPPSKAGVGNFAAPLDAIETATGSAGNGPLAAPTILDSAEMSQYRYTVPE